MNQEEFNKRRRTRSLITAGLLIGLVVLFYMITLARIGSRF
jgi:hypothetical protein